MPLNTLTVGFAITPAVIQTFVAHYINRKPLAQKPTAHISYHEGLELIRKFLLYASHHPVEDLQRFTGQWVPHPAWVKVDEVKIPEEYIERSAEAIQEQLGPRGIQKVGGKTWWQWRRPGTELEAEWIEMRSDYNERKRTNGKSKRIVLYVHGGAYFFGSVDEHRFIMQRIGRKLQARVLARVARYRLAPQFPFPCGLHDCLAVYLFLLSDGQDPSTIILAGDSAGGGMVLSMLVILRDRGIPLPAGAVLISPWVDLTHSFPSLSGDAQQDYIPAHGFHHSPSPAWPPPNSDDMLAMEEDIVRKLAHQDTGAAPLQTEQDAVQGFHVDHHPEAGTKNDSAATGTATNDGTGKEANTVPGMGHDLSIMIDGNLVEIKDQIQLYTHNSLIAHPLVSPALAPSLGGLPPLLIMVGGGEMLRDEQIYVAHKAANPTQYPPDDAFLDENPNDHNRDQINRWKPTDVQLQVWDDLCHVAPTLSFTRPAKFMFRSIAQFSAWALARAQKTEIEILDDDDVSVISRSDSDEENGGEEKLVEGEVLDSVGKAGDPLPPFKNHMIRQKVDRHGHLFPLESESELPGCCMSPADIGVIKEGPVKKWMAVKKEWDTKFAHQKRRVQKKRAKEMAEGYQEFGNGEVPPPSALAGRRKTGEELKADKKTKSWGMSLWGIWGSKHDEKTMVREREADTAPETATATPADGAGARGLHDIETPKKQKRLSKSELSRSHSRRRTVTDQNQTGCRDESIPPRLSLDGLYDSHDESPPWDQPTSSRPAILVQKPSFNLADGDDFDRKRPKAGGIAFPFTLNNHKASVSMTTLTSEEAFPPGEDVAIPGARESGYTPRSSGDAQREGEATRAKGGEKGSEKDVVVVQEGAERPELETFVTALDVRLGL
ncbi:hypothetical protein HYALB_00002029 [Hymenoscyphus albidus]|uniref:Alpha/beta hydrolase fold-3 domain-containing protein n=1 Tax=Hymenoscyphus albidus TaxID=595503 RepID=A0A9N9Q2V2_9HELO|nr:hypothetical protein HYALB_00002029 [Hymenoscyphus albidus]